MNPAPPAAAATLSGSPGATPAPSTRCHVATCRTAATHRPILCIALVGRDHVSRVALPTQLCSDHRDAFAAGFFTPARRAQVESTLQSRGRDSPDWARTHLEFA